MKTSNNTESANGGSLQPVGSAAQCEADYNIELMEYQRTKSSRAFKDAFDALRKWESALRSEKRQNNPHEPRGANNPKV